MTDAAPALLLDHIEKRFGAVQALADASLTVRHGTVHALLGENGAGKTTLMRVAYGMEAPNGGQLRIRGKEVRLQSPADAMAHGVGMVHQHFTLVSALTVAENFTLGGHGLFDAREAAARMREVAALTGLAVDPQSHVRDLPVTAQQRLELLKVLSRDADILILDEPTAVLAPAEANQLLHQLRQLADAGRAVILITHKLHEALAVADDVTVLRHGVTSLSRRRADIDEDQLVEAMLGRRQVESSAIPMQSLHGRPVISARDVSIADARGTVRVRRATFEVQSGEIVGIAGVEGSGHRELLRAIAGRLPITSGVLVLPDVVGFIPDDRHRDGLVLEMSLVENYALRGAGQRRGLVHWRDLASHTRAVIKDFDVRANGEAITASELSGGNQQKFILGRELHESPPVLVAENPTRGLDVRAAAYLRDRMLKARNEGVGVVVHSADLEEVVSIANRMLVVYAGEVRELPVDADVVGRAMLGAA